jgi:hypothetical protein
MPIDTDRTKALTNVCSLWPKYQETGQASKKENFKIITALL